MPPALMLSTGRSLLPMRMHAYTTFDTPSESTVYTRMVLTDPGLMRFISGAE